MLTCENVNSHPVSGISKGHRRAASSSLTSVSEERGLGNGHICVDFIHVN